MTLKRFTTFCLIVISYACGVLVARSLLPDADTPLRLVARWLLLALIASAVYLILDFVRDSLRRTARKGKRDARRS